MLIIKHTKERMISLKNLKKILFFYFVSLIACNSYGKTWNFQKLEKKGIDNSFLCFMDGKFITDHTSPQYEFIHGAKPMNYGIYNKNDHYLVAVSPIYGKIGDEIFITFRTGVKIRVYIGDYKKTSETKKIGYGIHLISETRGCQVEFIVDSLLIPTIVDKTGDFSTHISRYSGGILEIENKRIK